MAEDIFIDNKDFLYGDNILDELSKEYQWSSLLDVADASPSEILADAAPTLVYPFSPILSIKSSPPESSSSDSGSEDDSKNSSSSSDRQTSLSPLSWSEQLVTDSNNDLKLEDVEQFLLKAAQPLPNVRPPERSVPVVAIENGVIRIGGVINQFQKEIKAPVETNKNSKEDDVLQNSYYKVVNENSLNSIPQNKNLCTLQNLQSNFKEPKNKPNILKRTSAIVINGNEPMVLVNGHSAKIAITTILPNATPENIKTYVSPLKNNIVTNSNHVLPTCHSQIVKQVQNKIPKIEIDATISPTPNFSNLSDAELRAFKKQQRMIKNRESACQSRQKKKDYVTALEQQLLEAHQEIARLKLENKLLKDQMQNFGRGRKLPRLDPSFLLPKKKIAVLFAMVFMVSINFNMIGWNTKPLMSSPVNHGSTRHLLWTDDNVETDLGNTRVSNRSVYGPDCNSTSTNTLLNMNQTENRRITGELNRWIGGGKTLNWTSDDPQRGRKVYINEDNISDDLLNTYKSLLPKMNFDNTFIDFLMSTRNPNKVLRGKSRLKRLRRNKELDLDYDTVYPKPMPKSVVNDFFDFGEWSSLLEALQRRDDTFYIVGVGRGEHLLLPAVSHNVTHPPKMALILPAKTGNDSLKSDHVTLMQIDCSVVNTTLVQLKSESLPESIRISQNNVEKPNVARTGNATHNYRNNSKNSKIDSSLINMLRNSSNVAHTKKETKPVTISNKSDTVTNYLFSKDDHNVTTSVQNQLIKKRSKVKSP